VVIPPHIRRDVSDHLDLYVGKEKEALLFAPALGGCHLSDSTFRVHFGRALGKIGRQGVRVHDLRHFAGTQTARVGNLRETMSRLGHSTVAASMAYQGLVNGRDVEIAEALSGLAQTETP
jgi:integrase